MFQKCDFVCVIYVSWLFLWLKQQCLYNADSSKISFGLNFDFDLFQLALGSVHLLLELFFSYVITVTNYAHCWFNILTFTQLKFSHCFTFLPWMVKLKFLYLTPHFNVDNDFLKVHVFFLKLDGFFQSYIAFMVEKLFNYL